MRSFWSVPTNSKAFPTTGLQQAATNRKSPTNAWETQGNLFASTTEPRQACSHTLGGHSPSDSTNISLNHETPFPVLHTCTLEWLWDAFLPLLMTFRHPRNQKDCLAWATLNSTSHELPGSHPCKDATCKTCGHRQVFKQYDWTVSSGEDNAASCKTSNTVYLTTCRSCGH